MRDPDAPIPVVHGTLGLPDPATAATGDELPGPLTALRRTFDQLMRDYAAGSIDRGTVVVRLAALTCTDGAGTVWTIGASSNRWYRRPTGSRGWTPASPDQWAPGR